MARILVLTDRPQTDDRIVSRTCELVHRLKVGEVAVVVARSTGSFLIGGCSLGVPDSGFSSPDMYSVWAISHDCNDAALSKQFLTRCRQDAAFYELNCETAQSDTPLRRTAMILANAVGLMVVTRETLFDENGKLESLRMLLREAQCPWVICPSNAEPWKRVVVAIRSDAQRDKLITWGQHWSEQFEVPLLLVELDSPPPRSVWSKVTDWLPWSSSRQHQEAVREGLLDCGLGPGDLLLVGREPARWPHLTNCGEVSLDDLVAVAPCSVGVAPTITNLAICELLFPHGVAQVDSPHLDIAAA